MESLKQYEHKEFGKLRVFTPKGQLWFLVSDVDGILDDPDFVDIFENFCNPNGVSFCDMVDEDDEFRTAVCIDETNLFRLLNSSRMPKAEEFQQWIEKEVIPDIKKTGKSQSYEERLASIEENLESIKEILESNKRMLKSIKECLDLLDY